ncbi:MAG: 1-acyl-sn-glycerol-3-phosphate acyltransferase, partial [Candidatus Aminicenantes bacterium]|nr:1-acyl-sn-glycerol-3-phosphate acyltransferase [Candidatus Aminicenantes bacterium]
MKEFYTGNTYRTADGHKTPVWDFILLRTRLYFYIRVIGSILKYSLKYARKGLYSPQMWATESNDILKICEDSGGKIEVTGLDNIRSVKDEPVVLVGNHMGLLETLLLPSFIEPIKRVTFIVKSSLLEFPYFGDIMRSTNPIIVGRENPREDLIKVLEEGAQNLKKKISVALFPQSTRQPFFDTKKFNSLG